ncbi:MAG: hypothetical protein JNL49_02830 [Bacteroidia bacterium]|nr:hypothetical protein [Bacteroidia bacterium]
MIKKSLIKSFFNNADISLEKYGIIENEKITNKEYQSYINAFGPKLIQIGLLPTLILYSKPIENNIVKKHASSKKEADPNNVLKAILFTINKSELTLEKFIDNYKVASDFDKEQHVHNIVHACIALKLILRTYNLQNYE